MGRIKLTFLLLFLCTGQYSFADITIDDIKDGIKMRSDLFQSVVLDYDYSYSQPDSAFTGSPDDDLLPLNTIIEEEYQTLRLGEKIRLEKTTKKLYEGEFLPLETIAWDGQVRTSLTRDLVNSNAPLQGNVTNVKGGPFLGNWQTIMEVKVFDIDKPLAEVLDMASWSLEGMYDVGEYSTAKIVSENLWQGRALLEVWIAPENSFAPVKMIFTIHVEELQKDIVQTLDNVVLEKSGNVWVIKEARVKVFNPLVTQKSKGVYEFFKSSKYLVDQQIDDDQFRIEFPKGTYVYDGILKQGYIAGEGIWIGDENSGIEFVPFETQLTGIANLDNDSVANYSEEFSNKVSSQNTVNTQRNSELNETEESSVDTPEHKNNTIVMIAIFLLVAVIAGFVFKRTSNG